MTVTSTINRVSYNGNGSTAKFAVPFEFFEEDELQVKERVTASGAETTKMLNSDYTVEGGNGATGTVMAVTAPPATVSWTIQRKTKQTQQVDYTDNDPFPASTHEKALDRVTMIAQDSEAATGRSLKFPVTDSESLSAEIPNSVLRASKFLAFDSSGIPIASAGPTGDSSIPVSSFIETLLDDTDAAVARKTLGLVIGADVSPAGIVTVPVGAVTPYLGASAPTNWLLLNGDTIGNARSSAIEKSDDYEALFKLLWESMANSEAPVSTGRGASAQADWDAGKALNMPDARGRVILGSGSGIGLTARTHGATNGFETHTLTVAEMPEHTHTVARFVNSNFGFAGNPSSLQVRSGSENTSSAGQSQPHNNMQPWLALNWIVKV